jgi:hypothetical protein
MSFSNEMKTPKEKTYKTQHILNICDYIPPSPHPASPYEST